jgi:hypothetical protein
MHQIRQRTQTNTRPYFTCGGLSSEEMKGFDFIGYAKAVKSKFDSDADLESKSVRALSVYTGISSATLSRFFRGHKVDLETALILQFYSDVHIKDFIIY